MAPSQKKHELAEHRSRRTRPERAAIGLEAEFALLLDDVQVRPEDIFGSPRAFIRGDMMHRRGTSYHLPTGGAIYFDTGVIEIATPVIEIERGCAARAGRSLWEAIHLVRCELDDWQQRDGREPRLVGFSTHYNVSLDEARREPARSAEQLAWLLAHILPVPVMLLATNRRSTGVGVRPRGDRIEITVDFTPSPALMVATAATITGIVRAVMQWESFDLAEMERRGIPRIAGYVPVPHTTRRGWLAHFTCYPDNPFTSDIDRVTWPTTDGRVRSLRGLAATIFRRFARAIHAVADPFTYRFVRRVLRGDAPSLLELDDRPGEYEDVGRSCTWEELFPARWVAHSPYERVLIRAIAGQRLNLFGRWYTPVAMDGWSRVVFRRDDDRTRHTFPIDFLRERLHAWDGRRSHARA